MYVAVFDIGTSSIKGMLVDQKACLLYMRSVDIETHYGADGEIEQSPLDWWEGVQLIAKQWWSAGITPDIIAMVTFSGQMEDVIPIVQPTQSQPHAILYSDMRAEKEAIWIQQTLPAIHRITGNTIKGSTPGAKLIWMKQNRPSEYAKVS